MYTWMQSSRETFTLCSILGPPIPKGNANGNIFSIFMSAFLAYVPPYANRVGAECWNTSRAKISEELYRCVLWWVLRSGEIIRPAFIISFNSLIGWTISVVFCWDIFYQKRLGAILWYGGVQIAWMARFLDKPCQNINVQLCVNSGPFADYLFLVSFFHTAHNIYARQCLLDWVESSPCQVCFNPSQRTDNYLRDFWAPPE